jgi:hypothetical protein
MLSQSLHWSLSITFTYHDVGIVRKRGRATHVWKKRLWRHGNLCAWYLVCRGLVTCTRHRLFDDDELGFGPSGHTEVLQYSETIIVSPVMENFGDEEDGDVVLLRRLWTKEVVAYITKCQCESLRWYRINKHRSFTRPDSTASGMFFFQNCGSFNQYTGHTILEERGSNPRTSTASLTTGSRS